MEVEKEYAGGNEGDVARQRHIPAQGSRQNDEMLNREWALLKKKIYLGKWVGILITEYLGIIFGVSCQQLRDRPSYLEQLGRGHSVSHPSFAFLLIFSLSQFLFIRPFLPMVDDQIYERG